MFSGSVHIFPCSRIDRPILEIYKSLTDTLYECRNWETEHYNSVLEITVSFLGIHIWEPDIYIGFSPVLPLQCSTKSSPNPRRRRAVLYNTITDRIGRKSVSLPQIVG
jgi:hypothetical protein